MRHVAAMPGASASVIARAVGMHESTVTYHLRRLARRGLVHVEPRGRERRWYAAGCGLCPVLRAAIPILRRDEARRVAAALDETPRSASVLARRADVRVGTVRWTAATLEQAGIVQKSRGGRVALHEGARVCIMKAGAEEACGAWGACPMSRRLLAPPGGAPSPARRPSGGEADFRQVSIPVAKDATSPERCS